MSDSIKELVKRLRERRDHLALIPSVSKTVDDLMKIFEAAADARIAKQSGVLTDLVELSWRAGIRAVVMALRPNFEQAFREGGFYLTSRFPVLGEKEYAEKLINEILGDAGEKVALPTPTGGEVMDPNPYSVASLAERWKPLT